MLLCGEHREQASVKRRAIHLTVSKQRRPSAFAISPVLEAMGKGLAHTPYSRGQGVQSGGGGLCVVLVEASPTGWEKVIWVNTA